MAIETEMLLAYLAANISQPHFSYSVLLIMIQIHEQQCPEYLHYVFDIFSYLKAEKNSKEK